MRRKNVNSVMDVYVRHTQNWLSSFVVKMKLCPFAAKPFKENVIHYRVSMATRTKDLLHDLMLEVRQLQQTDPKSLETTLLIHPNLGEDFEDYLDLLELANQLLEVCDLNSCIQIASFHPDYQFQGTEKEDVSNYTNRSPYPMLHLLREASVTKATEEHNDINSIPKRNILKMEAMGLDEVTRKWKELFLD